MRSLLLAWLLVFLTFPMSALAYRPFVSTDAAVAERGVSEVELGIVDFVNRHGDNTVASPALRYNFGFARNWEVVAEGAVQVYDSAASRDLQILDSELNLKGVLLEGPLQHGHSPLSLALEVGTLLPETVRGSGFGLQSLLIGSFRIGRLTWHVNGGGGLERDSLEPVALWGVIVERPLAEKVRIAAEFNGESVHGSRPDNSVLAALLWDCRKVTYDTGVRFGITKQPSTVSRGVYGLSI